MREEVREEDKEREEKERTPHFIYTRRQMSRAVHATVNLCARVYKQSWFNNPIQLNNKEIRIHHVGGGGGVFFFACARDRLIMLHYRLIR